MKALILVDIQNDFMPSGTLPVPEGDQIVSLVNEIQEKFDLIVATQDWHPGGHKSFATNHIDKQPGEIIDLNGIEQILWPAHSVQGSEGAEFFDGLKTDKIDNIIKKGTDPEIDSYSGFFDNDQNKSTGLELCLRKRNVSRVFIVGLALDYCVKFTAMDANRIGFETTVILDATRGVDINEEDSQKAVEEMQDAGIKVIQSSDMI